MPLIRWRPSARVALLLVGVAAAGCEQPPPAQKEAPPAPVTVTAAAKRTVPLQLRAIGSVRVISTVSIRPRVGGELTEVHFKEGDSVAKGQKLFTIDPRPYEAAVRQAEATLAKDKAVLRGAQLDLDRIERINTGGAAATAELDAARTAVATAEATLAADQAALNSAKLQATFTTIYSPLDGRTGGLLVTPGNLVAANDPNPLVVINQVSPIYVAFSIPEQELPAVTAAQQERSLTAAADLRDGKPPVPGTLAVIDNTVDVTTGMGQLRAEFENKDRRLWPGQFVDVVLTVGDRADSVVVPTAAVQSGQQGQYVYVVTPDQKAELRQVTVAFETGSEAVIATGLAGGEAVVLEGQIRLAPGVKVEVKGKPADKPAPAAEGAK